VTGNIRDVIQFKYQNSPLTVVAQEAISEFTIHASSFGPYSENQEFELPRWAAEILLSRNLVRLKSIGIDLPDLQKALWRETGESALQTLPANFFFQIQQTLRHLTRENQKAPNDIRSTTQQKMEQVFRDLLTSRTLKLMKISLWEERIQNAKKKMTKEEQWLLDRLVPLLRNWQQQILEVKGND
jgi:hypothetical protein